MLSISLGPFALPVAPLLLLLAIWGASWLASRLAHLALQADLYIASPWSALDVRDGGWHLPTGVVAGVAWLVWRGWRVPALRRPLAVSTPLVNADFDQRVVLLRPTPEDWVPSPMAGVLRRPLDRVGGEIALIYVKVGHLDAELLELPAG